MSKSSGVMFRLFRARLSTNTTPTTSVLSNDQLLTGTGAGPFIELPQFRPIGDYNNLINVRMPQLSNLNVRYGSLIGINGQLDRLNVVNRPLGISSRYQILQSETAVSLILGGTLHQNRSNHYHLLEINDNHEQWTIYNDENLVAWTGYDFALNSLKILDKWSSFQTTGSGQVLISDGNKLLQLELGPDESVLVDANNIIACNSSLEFTSLQRSVSWPLTTVQAVTEFVKRRLAGLRGLKSWLHSGIDYYYDKIRTWLRLNVTNKLRAKPIMAQIHGPSKIILGTNGSSNTVFSKREIDRIYKH